MKILIEGKNAKDLTKAIKHLEFEIVSLNPDVIISYGGDGTLLSLERKYPGVPKLPIRDSLICKKCPKHKEEILLQALLQGKLKIKEYQKLHTNIYGTDLLALNDFVVRNENPTHTIRFKVFNNGIPVGFFIGDGIVVATPFGSTGYFKSITKTSFEKESGFAMALNNIIEKNDPIHICGDEDDKTAQFMLVRGKATLSYDNSPDIFHISEGTKLSFELSEAKARIYELESLRCPNCQVIRN